MASSQVSKGRGRSRQGTGTASTESIPAPPTMASEIIEMNTSSTSNDVRSTNTLHTATVIGRGRGDRFKGKSKVSNDPHLKVNMIAGDPRWEVSDLTDAQFKTYDRPSKPLELGITGQPINLRANYFSVQNFPREGLVYQYHFDVKNRRNTDISRDQRRALFESWLRRYCEKYPQTDRNKIAFDNQNTLIVLGESLSDIDEFGINEEISGPNRAGRYEQYSLTVKRVGKPVDLKTLTLLEDIQQPQADNNLEPTRLQSIKQVLSIVAHERCSSKADFIYNRTFFSQPTIDERYGHWDLGLGKALWRGFYSCLVFSKGTNQLLMNLDISHAVFQKKQPFVEFLCEIMRHSPCGKYYNRDRNISRIEINDVVNYLDQNQNAEYYDGEIEFLLKQCKYLSVRSQLRKKVIGYTIHGFGQPASTQTFPWNEKNNELITVENFFKEKYGYKLKYPSLPTVEMKKQSYVPMEILDTVPVRVKRITDEQRASLCLNSSLLPVDYAKCITDVRHSSTKQCFHDDPFIKAWQLDVGTRMLTIPARVLPGPNVSYTTIGNTSYQQRTSSSVWNNTRDQFYQPTEFPSIWAMINLSSLYQNDCESFYNELSKVAADRGINCPPPVIFEEYNMQQHSIADMIKKLNTMMTKNIDCKFFIVLLPDNDNIRDRIYGELKKLCELESGFGIATQMIKTGKKLWSYSKLNNILLKINTKLKGINSILQVPEPIEQFFSKGHQIMYVGIDLSHGAPGSSRGRSAVAVVASADDIPNRYFKEVYMQERPKDAKGESWENVVDMKEIMKSLIRQYYDKHQEQPPKAIVIYRDGISESEFDTIFEKELMAIREACVELSPVYRPYLTYIVVNKRHHTRFFPVNSQENVPAGTVVDSHDVTNATTYDFFLTSHQAQKGTSRPTHYHVLYDDNKLKPDQVQLLTNALCYTSARCTRSISIPAPVKYADLLAFRAAHYININDPVMVNTQSNTDQPTIPVNESVEISKMIKSQRIVLSSKLDRDCPFFV
ncbi:hypothetical protein I4U23_013631 [Adineta vaga]|nr:hypothetical protein I4U23_013631 [Adineta vaga]